MSPRSRKPAIVAGDTPATTATVRRRKPHALTQAQLVNKLLKLVGPSRPARSSIRLARGPRGQVMPEVLIHAGDEPGLTTIEQVEAKATEVFDRLSARYPLTGLDDDGGNGGGGRNPSTEADRAAARPAAIARSGSSARRGASS